MPSTAKEVIRARKAENRKTKHGGTVAKTSVSATRTSQGGAAEEEMNKPTEKKPVLTEGDDYFKVEHLSLQVEGHDLILDSSIELQKGRRYGLVGPNGSGKSTLLAAMGSTVPVHQFMTFHLLADAIQKSDLCVLDAVMGDDHLEEKNRLEQLIAESPLEHDNEEMYKELDEIGPKARHRACEILAGFGFPLYMFKIPTSDFSDGWRMRIALARALYLRTDILLLDGPTKHLDFEACAWLEERLSKLDSIVLVISNSQSFLTNVCTDIIEIDMHEKMLVAHPTKYDQYLEGREKQRSQTLCNQEFKFNNISWQLPRGNPPVIQCLNAFFSYSQDKVILNCLHLGINFNSKIALIGPSGSGKSTLLKLLSGTLAPSQGKVSARPGILIRSCDHSSITALDEEMLGIHYMRASCSNTSDAILTAAASNFGLSEQVLQKKIKRLSDGQRMRLIISTMAAQNPHILLLDEPTDHLDFEAVGLLAEGLNKWNGAVVIAGHDSRIISLVTQETWICENQFVTTQVVGDVVTYQQRMIKKAAEVRYLVRLQSTVDLFGLFSIGSYRNVAIPCLSYMKYLDAENNCSREPTIPLDRFKKRRYMTAYAPCNSLEEGFLQIPGEIIAGKSYRITTEVSKKISSSLLEALWTLDKVSGFCLSDFTKKNVLVTPSGEIKFRGVKLLSRTDDLVIRNLLSAHTILEDLFSTGGKKPPVEIGHLLNLMKHHPEKRELVHEHASLIPLPNQSDCYMKLYGCLNDTIEPTLRDEILEDVPHADTFEKDVQSNQLLKKYFEHNGGKHYITPVPIPQQGQTLTTDELKSYKRQRGKKFTDYLRNRIAHRMEHFRSLCRYTPDMADLAAHVRFPLVNCYLQEKLFDAGASRDLMLRKLIQ